MCFLLLIALLGLLVSQAHLLDGLSVQSGVICGCQPLPTAIVLFWPLDSLQSFFSH